MDEATQKILDELTEDEQNQLEIDKRKDSYKKLNQYIQTDDFDNLCKYFEEKGLEKENEIKKLLKNRVKTDGVKSQLDKDIVYTGFLSEVIEKLGNSDGEIILKEFLQINHDNVETHILNKIEEGYDLPLFTEIDLLKQIRIDYLLIRDRIRKITASFIDSKEEKQDGHPYED